MSDAKILVCEDEPHILRVVSIKLQNAGFEVITAMDGQEGYDLAVEHQPDLIFTDYQMPELSGLELCAEIQSNPQLKSTTIAEYFSCQQHN